MQPFYTVINGVWKGFKCVRCGDRNNGGCIWRRSQLCFVLRELNRCILEGSLRILIAQKKCLYQTLILCQSIQIYKYYLFDTCVLISCIYCATYIYDHFVIKPTGVTAKTNCNKFLINGDTSEFKKGIWSSNRTDNLWGFKPKGIEHPCNKRIVWIYKSSC